MTGLFKLLGTPLMALAIAALFTPTVAQAGDAEAGKASYATFCLTCHGPTGAGDGPVGVALQPPPRNFGEGNFLFDTDGDGKPGTDADLKNVIKNGAQAYGGSPLMTPWGHLQDADLENLVAFVRTLKGAAPVAAQK